ncbi:copper amine oxidase N-terminal domain-containing protein [Paenibacillus sp. sptzw28]|uniref:stalk domain-containing protein n=1 Tax=Paenibacillus sp. sptzw28 TaxID=715179 RepID=UPI001C6EBFF1|nr:stalk domain-containing protein [Paenibacillus sp. sptzw28]QYR21348.1 copper amine oxidase N-terminal domain-containing protein [Paenibacillus sp. sptzw28]
MQKIQAFILVTLLLVLAFSGTVSAAAQQKAIRVWVEDKEVKFDVSPVLANNSTYVEFRALFTALGYTIAYDAKSKTITGHSGADSIILKAVTGQAVVNGKAAAQKIKLLARNGRTLVPLRFVGEATGKLVDWNQASQTILIKGKGPTEADKQALQAFLDKQNAYELNGDVQGMLSTLDPKSPFYAMYAETAASQLAKAKVRTTSQITEVSEIKPESAVMVVKQHSEKVGGGFYLDNESVGKFTLTRGADKEWKLYSVQLMQQDFLNADEVLSHEAEVPAEVKDKIAALVDRQIQTINDEDLKGYEATFVPKTPGLGQMLESVKQLFSHFDLKYTVEKVSIVDYTGTEAVVNIVQKVEKINGPQFQNSRFSVVTSFKKTDAGEWLSTLDSKLIHIDVLK